MGQFLRINGDYNIEAVGDPVTGGTITLYTGDQNVGQVIVTGNLVVQGDTTTVSAEDLNVSDNIILLNVGETGTNFVPGGGVTLRYSGIEIDRGPALYRAGVLFDEQDNTWNFAELSGGTFSFANSSIRVRNVKTSATEDNGNLWLLGGDAGDEDIGYGTSDSPGGIVHVSGTTNYEDRVELFGDDAIPNKKYVDDAIFNNPTFQIKSENTRIIVADSGTVSGGGSIPFYESDTGLLKEGQANESFISVVVDGTQPTAVFFSNRTQIEELEFIDNVISNNNTAVGNDPTANIYISTQGTGKVVLNYALQLDKTGVTPAYVPSSTLVYANDLSVGQTGVYFTNDSADAYKQSGELVSKNRALLFSMIF